MKTIHVRSEISGTVCEVGVTVGQQVQEGDIILTIESMKMEIPIEAACDGTVTQINHQEGDPINEDDEIAIIEVS